MVYLLDNQFIWLNLVVSENAMFNKSPENNPCLQFLLTIKVGVHLNLSEILRSLKGLKEKKGLEHHQTVERPRKGVPGWWAAVWCTSTNF